MAAPATVPGDSFNFRRNLPYRSGAAGINLDATKNPAVLLALTTNTPFPPGDISLADISATANTNQNIIFDSGQGKVSFAADGGVWSGLGIYTDPANAVAALKLSDDISTGFTLPKTAGHYWVILRWGYDVEASGNGSIALSTASVQFGANGSSHGKFAVLRFLPTTTPARTAIQDTIDAWVLPSRVNDANDLLPGSCIIAEVDGAISAKLGITYGYNFNWVREAKLAGLSGDIGLKIQLGVSAALGFSLTGAFAVVLCREGADPKLRLKLFKQKKQGFSFAFDAGAIIQLNTGSFLPNTFDDFITAVLGIHNQQLLKDLKAIESWAGGNTSLSGALNTISPDYINQLLRAVTGDDPATLFNQAKQKVVDFLNTWGGLDSKVAALLWKYVNQAPILANIQSYAAKVANAATPDDYAALLNQFVKADFLSTPAGQFAETLALGELLTPITNSTAFTALKKAAGLANTLLSAATSENAILKALHQWIDQRIGITQILGVINQTTFDNLDEWLKAKIGAFLDEKLESLPQVQTVRRTINLLQQKSQVFYDKVVKALNDKYNFSLSALYESTTTTQALIDVEFDFTGGKNPAATLKDALSGNFNEILLRSIDGVTVNQGAISHQLQRHTHIDLRLPFYDGSIDHLNDSVAKINAGQGVAAQNGGLAVYDLSATDTVSTFSSQNTSESVLAIAGSLPIGRGNTIRIFDAGGLNYSYSYRQASPRLSRGQLQYQIKPYLDEYLPNSFGDAHIDGWLTQMENAVSPNHANIIGKTLLSLQISFPPSIMAGWLKAQSSERWFPYMQMSVAIQQTGLKKLLPFFYFADPAKYRDVSSAYLLLAYAAIPASTSVKLDGNSLTINTNEHVYWNWVDTGLRHAMLNSPLTQANLRAMLPDIYQRLQTAGLGNIPTFYKPGDGTVRKILAEANSDENDRRLTSLLQTEAQIVEGCLAAGKSMAQFVATETQDVRLATRALAQFGSKLAETFNDRVAPLYGGDALRPLGSTIYAIAAQQLGETLIRPSALFELIVLKPPSTFTLASFVNGTRPDKTDVLLDQTIFAA